MNSPEQLFHGEYMIEKICSKCDSFRNLDCFTNDKRSSDGKHSWCRKCRSDYTNEHRNRATYDPLKRQKLYWSSPHKKDYNKVLAEQEGLCSLCGLLPKTGEYLVTDHNHLCCPGEKSCGKCIRGLIHSDCNAALGFLKDDPALCIKAAEYLKRTAPSSTPLRINATPPLPTGSTGETP